MSDKSVAQKAHVRPGTRVAVLEPAPADVISSLGLPEDVAFVQPGDAQLVFLFAHSHADLDERMPAAVAALAPDAALWVFFRKGSRPAGLDMSRNTVWAIAEGLGMRPLGLVGVDDTWSAFRLRQGGQG